VLFWNKTLKREWEVGGLEIVVVVVIEGGGGGEGGGKREERGGGGEGGGLRTFGIIFSF